MTFNETLIILIGTVVENDVYRVSVNTLEGKIFLLNYKV